MNNLLVRELLVDEIYWAWECNGSGLEELLNALRAFTTKEELRARQDISERRECGTLNMAAVRGFGRDEIEVRP